MVIALQDAYLSSDLVSPVQYTASQELALTLSFTAPETASYYLVCALYTSDLVYISGTLFGILLPEGSEYAVNSTEYTSLWELEADEEKELPCKFTFDRSDVVLGVFLMKMIGDVPSFEHDEQIGSLSIQLSSPAPPITLESLIPLVVVVGMCGFMMREALKD